MTNIKRKLLRLFTGKENEKGLKGRNILRIKKNAKEKSKKRDTAKEQERDRGACIVNSLERITLPLDTYKI